MVITGYSRGFEIDENISSLPTQQMGAAQLFEERADLWIATADGDALQQLTSDTGNDAADLEVAFIIEEMSATLYIAANKNTSPELIEQMRNAMPAVD